MSTRFVTIESTKGRMVAELFDRDCPATVDEFERLVREGRYDATVVDAVAPDGLVEAGAIPDDGSVRRLEPETIGNRNRHEVGALTFLADETGMAGGRFGIVVADEGAAGRDGRHTVFGTITEGLAVARSLAVGDRLERLRVIE